MNQLLPIIRRVRRPLVPVEDVRPAEPSLQTTAPPSEESLSLEIIKADLEPEEPDAG